MQFGIRCRAQCGWRIVGAALLSAVALSYAVEESASPLPGLPVAASQRTTPVDFEKEILPVLKNNCLACHNQTKSKADLVLETPQTILKGGENGPAIVPGRGAESSLFKVAAHREKPFMPPKDNKVNAADLTPDQLALLKLWIDQGGKGEVRGAQPIAWLERPPALEPIFAVALTSDSQFAACGRGNQIAVYHVPSRQWVARLSDPRLATTGSTPGSHREAAHRDVVNALTFHPDGSWLASAGFREAKFWHRARFAQKVLTRLTHPTRTLAVSPDRQVFAWADADHRIVLWDADKGEVARTFKGHVGAVTSLAFSPDGRRLGSGSTDKTLRVWNIAEGTLLAAAESTAEINALTWLGNDQIAAGDSDGAVRLWAIAEGKAALRSIGEFKEHEAAVTALAALSGKGEFLSGSADGSVRHWNASESKARREFKSGVPITALSARPDGRRYATVGSKGPAQLAEVEDGKLVAEIKGNRYTNEFAAESERALVVAKGDVAFTKKSLETAEAEIKKQTERLTKATDTNAALEKVFGEKQKVRTDAQAARVKAEQALTNLLAEFDKTFAKYESADRDAKAAAQSAKTATTQAAQARLAADRAELAQADAEKAAADAASVAARARKVLTGDLSDDAKVAAQRVADDAEAVAQKARAFAETVKTDTEAKRARSAAVQTAADKAIDDSAARAFAAGQLKPAHDKLLAEAPDKRKQATNQIESATKSLNDAEQELKRAETRKSVAAHELELAQQAHQRAETTLSDAKAALAQAEADQKKADALLVSAKQSISAVERPFRSVAFAPDGRTLATVTDDGLLQTWSPETGVAFEVFSGLDLVGPIAFVSESILLATSRDQRLLLVDLNPPWTLERTLGTGDIDSPLADRVNAVRFSPDGSQLATGGGEPTRGGEIKLWDPRDGRLLREWNYVHSDAVLSLDFSPDGKYLASASADRFVRVTDVSSGKVAKAFEGHTSYVMGVAWKRDRRTLASAGADKIIKVWDFVTGDRRKNIEGAEKEVTSIAFVGASDEALAASGDGQVRLLRENGEKVRSFEGATDFVQSVAASADGKIVVAGGQDGLLRIWNGASGEKIAAIAPATK